MSLDEISAMTPWRAHAELAKMIVEVIGPQFKGGSFTLKSITKFLDVAYATAKNLIPKGDLEFLSKLPAQPGLEDGSPPWEIRLPEPAVFAAIVKRLTTDLGHRERMMRLYTQARLGELLADGWSREEGADEVNRDLPTLDIVRSLGVAVGALDDESPDAERIPYVDNSQFFRLSSFVGSPNDKAPHTIGLTRGLINLLRRHRCIITVRDLEYKKKYRSQTLYVELSGNTPLRVSLLAALTKPPCLMSSGHVHATACQWTLCLAGDLDVLIGRRPPAQEGEAPSGEPSSGVTPAFLEGDQDGVRDTVSDGVDAKLEYRVIRLRTGDGLLVPPGTWHAVSSASESPHGMQLSVVIPAKHAVIGGGLAQRAEAEMKEAWGRQPTVDSIDAVRRWPYVDMP